MKHGVLCAPLLLSVVAHTAFHGQSLPEDRYPEAVYYANAYAADARRGNYARAQRQVAC